MIKKEGEVMPAAARVTDSTSGICDIGAKCCSHGRNGACSNGSNNVFVNGLSAHRYSDEGNCHCPHGGIFNTSEGSFSVFSNGLPMARAGDSTVCQGCGQMGRITSGSSNVFIGG